MHISHLSLTDFRNFSRLDADVPRGATLLLGDNAQGKTSLLEAIYYLGALKSFRGAKTEDLVGLDQERAVIEAVLEGGPAPHRLRVEIRKARRRRLQLDGKRPPSASAWSKWSKT